MIWWMVLSSGEYVLLGADALQAANKQQTAVAGSRQQDQYNVTVCA
jgi:hypothetical protein